MLFSYASIVIIRNFNDDDSGDSWWGNLYKNIMLRIYIYNGWFV
jgi:hypothetical protein